jgi:CheY-like chemotaxis protein
MLEERSIIGTVKILLVEDEKEIREIFGAMLTSAGHDVDSASDGNEALELYNKRGTYYAVLTDILHPGPNGIELAESIWQKNPKQGIGFITGFPVLEKGQVDQKRLLEFVERVKTNYLL